MSFIHVKKVHSLGCVLFDDGYDLSNYKHAKELYENLKSCSIPDDFSYDFFILEIIEVLKFKNKLLPQLKLLNRNYQFDINNELSKKEKLDEFKNRAKEELKEAYHIGMRKDDGYMGFSKWNEKDPEKIDDRTIQLYEPVNTIMSTKFSGKRGSAISALVAIINQQDCQRLKKMKSEISSYMKTKAWHMFPFHIIKEIVEAISNTESSKKEQLTMLFEELLSINRSIAIEPAEGHIGYVMKDIKVIQDLEYVANVPLKVNGNGRIHLKRKAASKYNHDNKMGKMPAKQKRKPNEMSAVMTTPVSTSTHASVPICTPDGNVPHKYSKKSTTTGKSESSLYRNYYVRVEFNEGRGQIHSHCIICFTKRQPY